ncbi:hypothetical protein [Brachybacterium sacelli]|uniref:ParB/Sulfiredoxin domain-containing protein n=1 Tax=Brachybacterium sacelli TaxID=173364 RepID=A0ABS4X794_9MICO|nr:hypothetical protein [Brachybacterium sacelli]MBP2384336.1 hypothetical protein [Brachybacterium sacelli]
MEDAPEQVAREVRDFLSVRTGGYGTDARKRDAWAELVVVKVVALARGEDFDRLFRPLNPALRDRRGRLARIGTASLSPVSLVRVGELHFVDDGHHRLSIARVRGQLAVEAVICSVCTVAFACACLTQTDLQVKAAARR